MYYQLGALWERVLGIAALKPTDHFFDLGGTSLQAARMLTLLELEFGRSVSPTGFLQEPTMEHLAQLLISMHQTNASPLSMVQADGTSIPFFYLHGDFRGGGYYTRKVAAYLHEEQPFYTLAPHSSQPCGS